MNKELQKLLKQINDKKNEVKSLVNDGKLDKAIHMRELKSNLRSTPLHHRTDRFFSVSYRRKTEIFKAGH